MSSAYGEAEDGHVQSTGVENEGEKDYVEPDAAYGADDQIELSQPTVLSQSESEVEKSEDDNSLSVNGKRHSEYGLETGKHVSAQFLVTGTESPGAGRPSSADGSLSIPDDTPSIQVSRQLIILHDHV